MTRRPPPASCPSARGARHRAGGAGQAGGSAGPAGAGLHPGRRPAPAPVEVLGGPELLPTDARFAASPFPLVVHIVAAVVYAVLGAFQFSAGCAAATPAGTAVPDGCWWCSASRSRSPALWMTLVYPSKEGTGDML